MGITLEQFLSRYTKTLLRIQESYGTENPRIRFNLADAEQFLSKTASE